MTPMEFVSTYSSDTIDYDISWKNEPPSFNDFDRIVATDWSDRLSPVRDQGACSSSWAHAAIDLAEAANGKKGYSPQSIIDCSWTSTCGQGSIIESLSYITRNGVSPITAYPLTGSQQNCQVDAPKEDLRTTTVGTTWEDPNSPDEAASYYRRCMRFARSLKFHPYNVQTYGIAFMNYIGGIAEMQEIWDQRWRERVLTVTVVGFDPESLSFKIKTPLGAMFGEHGYLRVNWQSAHGLGICNKGFWLF